MSYLVGQKISLVKFTKDHVTKEYVSWLNDSETNRYLCVGRLPVNMDEIVVPAGNENLRFAIIACGEIGSEKSKYIGTISMHKIDWICRSAEIGYLIGDRAFWGKGIATESVKLITDYGFGRLNLNKIEAGVVGENIGSIRALEKNGFLKYGSIPEDYYLDGRYYDTVRFYKLQRWSLGGVNG